MQALITDKGLKSLKSFVPVYEAIYEPLSLTDNRKGKFSITLRNSFIFVKEALR